MADAFSQTFDLIIVGAGPSGAAAALCARKSGASVLLLDRAEFPRPRSCAGWIGPVGVEFCRTLGLSLGKCGATEFAGLALHTWDLRKETTVKEAALAGWAVDRAAFDHALVQLATAAGAHWFAALQPQAVALRDDRIELTMADTATVRGRMLIVADGLDSPTARLAAIPSAGLLPVLPESWFVEAPLASKSAGVDVFLAPGRGSGLATLVRSGRHARLSMIVRDAGGSGAAAQFSALCASLQTAGLLPGGGDLTPTRHRLPAGAALEMETHVGKRALLVGNAGGFVTSFSGEGIYPAMKSGWIAAEIALRAAKAHLPQDELGAFAQAWRAELGEYMRPPNTDLALLLPLVFSNAQMSKRVAKAFLLGEGF